MNSTHAETKASGSFVVANDKGLHTRPSTELVKCAITFKARIKLHSQDNMADAKSLLGILALAAGKGTKLAINAEGNDAKEAVTAILSLATNKFNADY